MTPGPKPVEFWVDVGGTFTDCVARMPDGSLRVHKILSSGVVPGRAAAGSTASRVLDPARRADPDGFFAGWRLSTAAGTSPVAAFDAATGSLVLARPLARPPAPGEDYALLSDEEAPVAGIRWLLGAGLDEPLGPLEVFLGTTRGTNALLEGTGAPTAFVTTLGFGDVLRIGTQNRPRLFDLAIRKPRELFAAVAELDERVDAAGRILRPLDEGATRTALQGLRDAGIASVAVCLLNAYRNPAHEERAGALAEELGFAQVSLSCRLAPVPRIVARGDTAVVDAALSPVIRDYVAALRRSLPEGRLRLMDSAGALADADRFNGKDSIFSGPAGGVVGFSRAAARAGFARAVGFDMGGTSTDVSRFDGDVERRFELELSDPSEGVGVRVLAPMLAIETVAAGGGSVCRFDGVKPVVGPQSAGADPGPACYGRGGPLTLTDVNLVLGRILPSSFPFPLDAAAAEDALDRVADEIAAKTGVRYGRAALAEGFVRIANANMAAPIRKLSLARGIDVRDHALVSFGGAGGQHACAVARSLGIRTVLVPPLDGVLSACGIGAAHVTRFGERHLGRPLTPETLAGVAALFDDMAAAARAEVLAEGVPADRIRPPRRFLDLRYRGQDAPLTVEQPPDGASWRDAFEAAHRDAFGFVHPGRPAEAVTARVEVTGERAVAPSPPRPERPNRPAPEARTPLVAGGAARDAGVFRRDALEAGDVVEGPAVILESTGTVVVDPGFAARVTGHGDLVLADAAGAPAAEETDVRADPVTLELFHNRFASIAEQMGALLRKTALSVNVKERLDFSCALFDGRGELVVNAPHIPVHLGAMGACVKALLEDVPSMEPGDVFVTNDPYRGGSHLPDVTVVTPVFPPPGAPPSNPGPPEPLFFTASRAHHAEIGGTDPGSMPPFSRTLGEEGVVIRNFRLVAGDASGEEALAAVLASGPHPSRTPRENLADIAAAVAANRLGARLLNAAVDRYGLNGVQAYMGHVRAAARRKLREELLRLPEGDHRFADRLDDGTPLAVRIAIRHGTFEGRPGGEAVVDFTGSGPVHPGNLNANPAIVSSAVLYAFRTLLSDDIPLNGGLLEPIEIVLPPGLLNPPPAAEPAASPAVAGGNVETSQRVVDVILGALGVAAASQGTMNNVTFGNESFGYYETVGGGSGACEGADGADAVHVHMTNTRITDAEVLEARYPVRLRRFAVRRGSGGAGRWRGGDGIVREIEFLAPVRLSLLTQRRTTAPFGLAGGAPGAPGRNLLLKGGTEPEELPPVCGRDLAAGDVLVLETPGGGGWGGRS